MVVCLVGLELVVEYEELLLQCHVVPLQPLVGLTQPLIPGLGDG